VTAPGDEPQDEPGREPSLTLVQMLGSALAAAIGVQTRSTRERDFARGRAVHFIVVGVACTALFVIAMVLLVRLIISAAG
jgi:hypothetical protein